MDFKAPLLNRGCTFSNEFVEATTASLKQWRHLEALNFLKFVTFGASFIEFQKFSLPPPSKRFPKRHLQTPVTPSVDSFTGNSNFHIPPHKLFVNNPKVFWHKFLWKQFLFWGSLKRCFNESKTRIILFEIENHHSRSSKFIR